MMADESALAGAELALFVVRQLTTAQTRRIQPSPYGAYV
jgi:hypothetical protein